jgi:diacylglycerol O-acyltransferase
MERLSGLDASFLYGETPETPTHTAPLWIFEPIPQGKSAFESFREHIRERLHLLPFFNASWFYRQFSSIIRFG